MGKGTIGGVTISKNEAMKEILRKFEKQGTNSLGLLSREAFKAWLLRRDKAVNPAMPLKDSA